jgi:hypothetical protein
LRVRKAGVQRVSADPVTAEKSGRSPGGARSRGPSARSRPGAPVSIDACSDRRIAACTPPFEWMPARAHANGYIMCILAYRPWRPTHSVRKGSCVWGGAAAAMKPAGSPRPCACPSRAAPGACRSKDCAMAACPGRQDTRIPWAGHARQTPLRGGEAKPSSSPNSRRSALLCEQPN